jgi:hypothetical protein
MKSRVKVGKKGKKTPNQKSPLLRRHKKRRSRRQTKKKKINEPHLLLIFLLSSSLFFLSPLLRALHPLPWHVVEKEPSPLSNKKKDKTSLSFLMSLKGKVSSPTTHPDKRKGLKKKRTKNKKAKKKNKRKKRDPFFSFLLAHLLSRFPLSASLSRVRSPIKSPVLPLSVQSSLATS